MRASQLHVGQTESLCICFLFVSVFVSVFVYLSVFVFVSVFEYVFKPQLCRLARLVWIKLDVSVFAFLFLIQNYWQSCCVLRIAVE